MIIVKQARANFIQLGTNRITVFKFYREKKVDLEHLLTGEAAS